MPVINASRTWCPESENHCISEPRTRPKARRGPCQWQALGKGRNAALGLVRGSLRAGSVRARGRVALARMGLPVLRSSALPLQRIEKVVTTQCRRTGIAGAAEESALVGAALERNP